MPSLGNFSERSSFCNLLSLLSDKNKFISAEAFLPTFFSWQKKVGRQVRRGGCEAVVKGLFRACFIIGRLFDILVIGEFFGNVNAHYPAGVD